MPIRRPIVEIVPKSQRTLAELSHSLNVINVLFSALLADVLGANPVMKRRLLGSLRTIRDHAEMVPEFQKAYDAAINLIESMR